MRPTETRLLAETLALDDVGVRNRSITGTYHRLARRLDEVVGSQDANWLTFGTWASASAGRFIRGEAAPVAWGAADVAAGNAAIIADIAPRFIAFLEVADTVGATDLTRAVSEVPCLVETEELAEAFDCYARASLVRHADPDDTEHAQLMLRANTLVAHHEQRMADDFVDRALPLGGPFGMAATLLVTVAVPEGDVHVSRDVPRPAYLHGSRWPPALERLTDPRLIEIARGYRQEVDSADSSNATSWEDFGERMGYIFCFFRAYQRDPDLRRLPDWA